ncbi:MAG: hemolysin family protein [Anaeroplasmataceae bacterium]
MVLKKLDIQSSVLTNFTNKHTIILVIIIVCIILSAFFSMSETVFSSVSDVKLKTAVEDRKSGSKKALYLTESFDKTLTTLLVGNNIVNTAMSVLAVTLFAAFIKNENYVSLVATAVMTVLLLIFGEILPKTIGKKYCDVLCFKLAPIIYVLTIILYPIVIIFRGIQKLVTGKEIKSDISEDELESIIDTMEEEGSIESDEVEYIKNIFDLNDRSVEDIMIHRVDVVAVDVNDSIEDIKKVFFDAMFSRIPVCDGDKDHIIGVLYERDFLKALITQKNVSIRKIMKPAKFVNKAMKVDDLIHELQKCKTHLAIVMGEYGDTQGIVTMEDALEEIVGEIYDEHDEVEEDVNIIEEIGENTYLVDGEIYVDYLYKELEIGEAPENSTQKLSTFLFEESEELPQVGNQVKLISSFTKLNEETETYDDYTKEIIFEIAEVDENRISKVKVIISDYIEE